MKTLQGSLSTLLVSGVTTLARCWRLERRDGAVFGFTDHDRQLIFAGTDYRPETGFTRSETQSRLGLAVDTMEVEGALSADEITDEDIALGLWDDAAIEIWVVDWSDTANRVLLRSGNLGEIVRGDVAFMAELRSMSHRLNQERGRTYQRLCDAVVGDARCSLDLTGIEYLGTGAVTSSDDGRYLVVSGIGDFEDGWFAQGLLSWTSGANHGAEVEVRRHAVDADGTVRVELWQKAARLIAGGDEFTVTAGCNKTFEMCQARFANAANFRGFPHVPGNDFALGVAKKDQVNDGGSFFND